ncbi:transposase [Hyphomicrobiaceae bacterium 22]|uniref:Transposase n=1 Tax=Prosthecodimorpha staleyi TaxID=2840188 RepID=A0A947DC29_9HYPH|nr:transposase [Prosthecodimorpha staleyi]
MPGARRRHLAFGPARSSGTGHRHSAARPPGDDRVRQRHRVHLDLRWCQEIGVAWQYIAPGKPTQNAFVESFNGRFRDECLNDRLFSALAEASSATTSGRRTTTATDPTRPPATSRPPRRRRTSAQPLRASNWSRRTQANRPPANPRRLNFGILNE